MDTLDKKANVGKICDKLHGDMDTRLFVIFSFSTGQLVGILYMYLNFFYFYFGNYFR